MQTKYNMCGIIWTKQRNGKPAVRKLRKLYHAQKSRGQLGFGYIEIDRNGVGPLMRTRFEDEIFKTLSKSEATDILFHHRFPTSTPNTPNTAHPIPVSNKKLKYDYVGVHNGVLTNHKELKVVHEKEGYSYTTELHNGVWCEAENMFYYDRGETTCFNDSEALIIDLAQAIESGADKIMARGSIAFIILQIDKETKKPVKMFYGRNTNPLMMEVEHSHIKISSMGSGSEVEPHKLHCYDYVTGEIITVRDFQVGEKPIASRFVSQTTEGHAHSAKDYNYAPGKEWNHALGLYVWPKRQEAGFDTSRMRELPAPVTAFDPDNEPSYDFTPVPGYEDKPFSIVLSGGTQEFWFLAELDDYYVNLIESIEYWRDYVRSGLDTQDKDKVGEGKAALALLEDDEQKLKHAINKIYPKQAVKAE